MTNKLKYGLIFIVCFLTIVGTWFIANLEHKSWKYIIIDNNGHYHKTFNYEVTGNCVKFTKDDKEFEICGNYQIVKNNEYSK